ncbi:MAG: TonB-dependent receptor [Bacteroidota bacterium]|nr:TonB-dependent receptor [Bacteroidota bacterium]
MYKAVIPFLLIFFLITSASVLAQQKTAGIQGKIISKDKTSASYVTIILKGIDMRTQADKNGCFSFNNLPDLNDTLVISGIGFKTYKNVINISNGQRIDLGIIHLDFAIKQLKKVEVNGRIVKSYKSDFSYDATKTQTELIDIPQAVSTVTKELINDKMQLHLTNALENISGVTQYSGYEEYNIRGLHAENPCLINGMRTFNTSLTSPMLVNVEKVEVIKGPTSVLYSNADPGGNINLVTKKPLPEKQYSFILGAGSWNAFNGQVDATGPLNKSGSWLYRLNAGGENTESFRNGYFLKSYQIAPSFSFTPNSKLKVNLDISVSHTHSVVDRGLPTFGGEKSLTSTPTNLTVIQPGDFLKENNVSTALTAIYKINSSITFNTGLLNYLTSQNLSEHGIKDYITMDSVNLNYNNRKVSTNTITFTNYFNFKFNTGKFKHQLLVGYDFIGTDMSTTQWQGELSQFGENMGIVGTFSLRHPQYLPRPVNIYAHRIVTEEGEDEAEGEYATNGVYVQEQLSYNKWQLIASLRGEFFQSGEDDDAMRITKLLPRIGITYAVAKEIRLYATYNRGFDPFEPTSVLQVFNQPFKPLNSEMFESGIKADLLSNKLSSSLAIYQISIDNLSVNANDASNPNLYIQRGEQRSRGIEAELQGNLTDNLSLAFEYALNKTEITKSINQNEIGTIAENAPMHSSSSWLNYNFRSGFLKGLGLSCGHFQTGKRNTLESGVTLPGYCVFNGSIHYAIHHINIAVNINNLFNTSYWASAYNNLNKWPGNPRNMMIRFGYSL